MIYRHRGYHVEIDDATQYATIYSPEGKPVGTLVRRRVPETSAKPWRVYLVNGNELCSRYSTSRSLFRDVVMWERLTRMNNERNAA